MHIETIYNRIEIWITDLDLSTFIFNFLARSDGEMTLCLAGKQKAKRASIFRDLVMTLSENFQYIIDWLISR